MIQPESKSVIVFGNGATGSLAALLLAEQGWRVQVLSIGPGASGLSSGAWDLGLIPAGYDGSLSEFYSEHSIPMLKEFFVDWPSPPAAKDMLQALDTARARLVPDLEMVVSVDRPLLLPCTHGSLRETFVAQKIQASADLMGEGPRRFGMILDPYWNFPGKKLCDRWNALTASRNKQAIFFPLKIEFSTELKEMETLALSLENPANRTRFVDCLRPFKSECDTLLLPPLSLSPALASEIQQTLGIAVAEPLCSRETVAGRRLQLALDAALRRANVPVQIVEQCRLHWKSGVAQGVEFLTAAKKAEKLTANQYLLCTGRWLGRGFTSEATRWEASATGIPISVLKGDTWTEVAPPASDYSKLGVTVDADFRARMFSGGFSPNVRALGSCIGGLDPAKARMGLGLYALLGSECARKMASI